MCAILGWSGRLKRGQWRRVHRLLTELLAISASRGTDATGFAALDARRGFVSDKRPVPSRRFAATNAAWNRLSYPSCLVAHCRGATHGSPHAADGRNNHPFMGDDLAVIVNGVSPNYESVARANRLRLYTECDSEVVLRLVESHPIVPQGLRACLSQLTGGMAAAVLDARRRSVWLARNEARPAWLFRLDGLRGWFACSTREIAEEALRRQFGPAGLRLIDFLAPGTVAEMTEAGTVISGSADEYAPVSLRHKSGLFASAAGRNSRVSQSR